MYLVVPVEVVTGEGVENSLGRHTRVSRDTRRTGDVSVTFWGTQTHRRWGIRLGGYTKTQR